MSYISAPTIVRQYSQADLTLTNGSGSSTATLTGGYLRLVGENAVRMYTGNGGAWTATNPRGILTLPTDIRKVAVLARVNAIVSGTADGFRQLVTVFRNGADPAEPTTYGTVVTGAVRLPSTGHWDSGPYVQGGDLYGSESPANPIGFTGDENWVTTTPSKWYGMIWEPGKVIPISTIASVSSPGISDLYPQPASGLVLVPAWPMPTQVLVALQQDTGITTARTIDVEFRAWCWT